MMNGLERGVPAFLASVTSPEEARLAVAGGASIIDCKDPSKGALGDLEPARIEAIVKAVSGRVPVSATIGDLPCDAAAMVKSAQRIAATGVDIVKVGFFGDADARDAIAALGSTDLGRALRVAVLMADRNPDISLTTNLARAGFSGVMLDTADKAAGPLPNVLTVGELTAFLDVAQENKLPAGLAGALRVQHIAGLVALMPDIIGFRGALCEGGRGGALSANRVAEVRTTIDRAVSALQTTKRSVA